MVDWLRLILVAAAVMIGLWGLLVVLAARLPAGLLKDLAGFLPACVTLARRLRADPRVPWQAKAGAAGASQADWPSDTAPVRRNSRHTATRWRDGSVGTRNNSTIHSMIQCYLISSSSCYRSRCNG